MEMKNNRDIMGEAKHGVEPRTLPSWREIWERVEREEKNMRWEIVERNKYDPHMAKVRIYAERVEELHKMDWEAMEREIGGKFGGVMYFAANPPYLEGD